MTAQSRRYDDPGHVFTRAEEYAAECYRDDVAARRERRQREAQR